MIYELMDTDGFNLVGAYGSEVEALEELRALVDANGPDYVRSIALMTTGSDGSDSTERDVKVIASGLDLLRRVENQAVANVAD